MEELNCNDEGNSSKDKLFDPSIDMLVNDFDDEQTLEEEEALAADEDAADEINSLQKEGDMPLEELLALYGLGNKKPDEMECEEAQEEVEDNIEEQQEEEQAEQEPSQLQALYEPITENEQDASRLLRSVSRFSEEEDDDCDYMPSESEWRNKNKMIMVGNDYQAVIPEGLRRYDDALPYENEDKLLWDPYSINDAEVEDFLKKAGSANKRSDASVPLRLRDDEQALFLLQQCGHNVDEALRRIRINVIPPADAMSLWSEEECRNFESGVGTFGKGFHRIQQNKVRTRSVGELVQFYYMWKKSERHDVFVNKNRLDKRASSDPDHTDFMDRFLEDQDGRDRSSSPNVQCSDKKHSTDVNQPKEAS